MTEVPTSLPRTTAAMKRFGQSAIATPANAVTIARMIVAVPTLWIIYERGASWLSFFLWLGITASDSLDGWLARRDGATRSGAFLDPVTDKAIVIGGLAVLAARGDIWWWPVIIIAVREVGISLYRSIAGRRGVVLPAQTLGKRKAFLQYCSVGFVILPLTKDAVGFQQAVLIAATALTVISASQILRHGYVDWQRRD